MEQIKSNVKPGQEVSVTRSVTKRVVGQKRWDFFLDIKNQVNEGGSLATERNENFCSAFVNS